MFSSIKQRLLLGVYIFILLSIPAGAYLASQQTNVKSQASEQKTVAKLAPVTPKPLSAAKELLGSAEQNNPYSDLLASPTPETVSAPTIATSFGPTLAFQTTLEGRPENNQSTKMFVGIAEGSLTTNPKFILSFTVNLPISGKYSNLSLAGLSPGTRYSALLKGSAQIANVITFTMSPAETNLNDGQPVNLTSGDLNEDNVVNSADYVIIQKAIGATSGSTNWNDNADLNKDGIINAFDLAIVTKNIGQTGASGAWTSPIPTATASAGLNTTPVGAPNGESGHWVWVPNITP